MNFCTDAKRNYKIKATHITSMNSIISPVDAISEFLNYIAVNYDVIRSVKKYVK